MLQPGSLVGGKYRIIRLMGEGGMGSVFEAEHQVLGSRVALKFLHPEIAEQPSLRQRFLQEARVSASIKDEHIVRVTDVDTSEEGAYLVMELLTGEPLTALLEREGPLDVERAVHFALQVCKGLSAAHALGIVHRDLKPDNVFVTQSTSGPLLKLLDFGIAKLRQDTEYQMTLTRPGSVMGTPEYMAPEQAFGAETVDRRSDIYSLGVMLFEMLSGKLPVHGEKPQEIAERILHGQILRLHEARAGLPHELYALVERATHANPDFRYPDVDALATALLPFAPSLDRLSAVGAFPQPPSGYATGLSTPFTPVAFTPVASDYLRASERGVPATIPPAEGGPPVVAQGALPRSKTQSMPEAANPVAAPRPAPATVIRKRRQGGGLGWAVAALTVAAAGFGAWLYYEEFVAISPTPPPQPVLRSTDVPAGHELPPELDEPELPPIGESPRPPQRGTPSPPRDGRNPPELPPIPIPSELPAIPSELPPLPPIPSEFPRSLPTFLPPIPGFPSPGLNEPVPSNSPE